MDTNLSERFAGAPCWFPELNLFETVVQRDEAWRSASRWLIREPGTWVSAMLWLFFLALGCIYKWEHQAYNFWPEWWPVWIFVGILALLGSWGLHSLFRSLLRRKLIEAGIPVCLRCGRDLRDGSAEGCRECRRKEIAREENMEPPMDADERR